MTPSLPQFPHRNGDSTFDLNSENRNITPQLFWNTNLGWGCL